MNDSDNEKKILKYDYDKLQLEFDTCKKDMESIQLQLQQLQQQKEVESKNASSAVAAVRTENEITSFLEIDEEKEELRKELYEVKHKLHIIEKEYETQKLQHQ